MLTWWIAIPMGFVLLVAADNRRKADLNAPVNPPIDNSNCVSLVIEERRYLSVNDTVAEWTCKQGELCQAPYAENAYSLTKTQFVWDKYMLAPEPCAVDGMSPVKWILLIL